MARRRRGNGEGSIYQRACGTWCATYSSGYDDQGKRKRRTVFGATKDEVQKKLTKVLAVKLTGPYFEPSRLKLFAFLDRWLEVAAKPKVKVTTYHSYRGVIRNHIKGRIGGITLAKLTPAHVQGLYGEMERCQVSPRVRQLTHAVLHRAMHQAMRWGLVMHNVCDAVEPPRVPKVEAVPLTPEQLAVLLKESASHRLHTVYVLAVGTGMRMGEMFGLQWPDADMKKGVVHVRRSLTEVHGKLVLSDPKTAGGRRAIRLPAMVVESLRRHKGQTAAEGWGRSPWVFCNTVGGPLRRSHFHAYCFKPLLKRAGLPDIRFHDLRHTSATLLLSAGIHPKVVQERLGHSQIGVTMDTYSHVLPNMQQEAAEKLDGILRAVAG